MTKRVLMTAGRRLALIRLWAWRRLNSLTWFTARVVRWRQRDRL